MKLYLCPDCSRAALPLVMMAFHMVDDHGWVQDYAERFLQETKLCV